MLDAFDSSSAPVPAPAEVGGLPNLKLHALSASLLFAANGIRDIADSKHGLSSGKLGTLSEIANSLTKSTQLCRMLPVQTRDAKALLVFLTQLCQELHSLPINQWTVVPAGWWMPRVVRAAAESRPTPTGGATDPNGGTGETRGDRTDSDGGSANYSRSNSTTNEGSHRHQRRNSAGSDRSYVFCCIVFVLCILIDLTLALLSFACLEGVCVVAHLLVFFFSLRVQAVW